MTDVYVGDKFVGHEVFWMEYFYNADRKLYPLSNGTKRSKTPALNAAIWKELFGCDIEHSSGQWERITFPTEELYTAFLLHAASWTRK